MSENSTLRNIISKYNLKKLTEKGRFIYKIYINAVLKWLNEIDLLAHMWRIKH